MLNNKIIAAMQHVRQHYSEITHVVYFSPTVWKYFTTDMSAPSFRSDLVYFDLLCEAADSLELEDFPFVYRVEK